MPRLASLALWDNSAPGNPAAGVPPRPVKILQLDYGRIVHLLPAEEVLPWARPIVAAALKLAPNS